VRFREISGGQLGKKISENLSAGRSRACDNADRLRSDARGDSRFRRSCNAHLSLFLSRRKNERTVLAPNVSDVIEIRYGSSGALTRRSTGSCLYKIASALFCRGVSSGSGFSHLTRSLAGRKTRERKDLRGAKNPGHGANGGRTWQGRGIEREGGMGDAESLPDDPEHRAGTEG